MKNKQYTKIKKDYWKDIKGAGAEIAIEKIMKYLKSTEDTPLIWKTEKEWKKTNNL